MDFSTLGATLVGKNGEVSVDSLKDLEYIGLYFSAHWCPPCRSFTPVLSDFYKQLKATNTGKKMEIVFVTCDKSPAQFAEYFGTMDWLAVPFEDDETRQELSSKYGVKGIPYFVVVNCKTGAIQKDGRDKVTNTPTSFPWE